MIKPPLIFCCSETARFCFFHCSVLALFPLFLSIYSTYGGFPLAWYSLESVLWAKSHTNRLKNVLWKHCLKNITFQLKISQNQPCSLFSGHSKILIFQVFYIFLSAFLMLSIAYFKKTTVPSLSSSEKRASFCKTKGFVILSSISGEYSH